MSCETITEALPWYLNRSLPEEEREEIRRHLATCERCREELAATLEVGRLHGTHPATETLVALAFGDLGPEEAAGARRHLEHCPPCREELSLVEASAGFEVSTREETPLPFPAPASRSSRRVPWWVGAAAVLALAVAGVWLALTAGLWEPHDDQVAERLRLEERLETLEAERSDERARADVMERHLMEARRELDESPAAVAPDPVARASEAARAEIVVLERRLAEMSSPQAGHPVLELVPQDMVLRGETPGASAAERLGASPWVTVLLHAPEIPSDGTYRIELREGDEVVWASEDVRPDDLSGFSLLLPSSLVRESERDALLAIVPASTPPGGEALALFPLDS